MTGRVQGIAVDATGVPRFSIQNLRIDPKLTEAENTKRSAVVHALYGWESYERIEAEFHLSVAPYMHLLPHGGRVDVRQLLKGLLEDPLAAQVHKAANREHLLSPIDVFALPFRHVTAHETMDQLATHLGIRYHVGLVEGAHIHSATQVSDLLFNAAVFNAILWAPNYFYFRSAPEEVRRWTLPALFEALRGISDEAFFILADNVEFITLSSGNILEQLFLWSSKLKKLHSAKLFTACLALGIIIWRSPLFGGSTQEITPLEWLIKSPEFAEVRRRFKEFIFLFTDRGFTRIPADLVKDLHFLHPGIGELKGQYSPLYATWNQVHLRLVAICSNSVVAAEHPLPGGDQQPIPATLQGVHTCRFSLTITLRSRVVLGHPVRPQ
jgi:hypothetical protein